jgi:hydroxymethylglutaryl-CoA reductase
MSKKTSEYSGFYKLRPKERLKVIKDFADLTNEEIELLTKEGNLKMETADRMIENVIGFKSLPLGIAVNFLINGKDYMIPMSIEEPSVVAAASNAAKLARKTGGFTASHTNPVMIGQIQAVEVPNPEQAKKTIMKEKDNILEKANETNSTIVKLGGGAKDLQVKIIDSIKGKMVITELFVDCRDAMGANLVNTMLEAVTPIIEKVTNGKVYLRIISNLATKRLARAKVVYSKEVLGGEDVIDAIIYAYAFAKADPYRAATHNKGIMNGIVAMGIALSQDIRALEAAAHAYASQSGQYQPLTTWEKNENGDLIGTIEIPMPVATVGGATSTDPVAKICRKILGVKTATELGEIMATVGLAQNFAAMRALATEGIQRGHMELHARNIAIIAGATGKLIDRVAEIMVKEKEVKVHKAKEILEELEKKS